MRLLVRGRFLAPCAAPRRGIGHLTSRDHAVDAIAALFEFDDDCEGAWEACERLFEHAERGTVTDEVVRSYADEILRIQTECGLLWGEAPIARSETDLAAMTALLRRR
ncbi:hypothetical protein [Streptomyces sp. H34-S4]|uniref:hypothetical protein n=1 Tax=Streptomyces sp. H34-S4 TaxID=2996463 RepID=UPI00226FC24E|nr:hypothetical protein [Streptomyces sp. H34-S4]MCY0937986.1 hypothetical protein [Streptomyces sp. H34-S4]